MADEETEEAKVVYEFRKNSQEVVRVSLKSFRGVRLVDVRVFFPVGGDEPRATRKGITISTALLPELVRSVEALQGAVEQEKVESDPESTSSRALTRSRNSSKV